MIETTKVKGCQYLCSYTVRSQGNTAMTVENALYCAINTMVVTVKNLTLIPLRLNVRCAIALEK